MKALLNTITCGDARELSRSIPDESIDLIFTDPPYLQKYMSLYDWLAEEAARVLKPGGFCLAYCGDFHKYEAMVAMGNHLDYYWDFVAFGTGFGPMIWAKKIIARHKSILAFSKGKGLPRMNTLSIWVGGGQDKRFHTWGQDESTARYYIDCFTSLGDIVWEPFCGGGTTPAVCRQLKRDFIAFEIDPDSADIARKRIETTQPLLMPEIPRQLELVS
jgi:DNA modification methylase